MANTDGIHVSIPCEKYGNDQATEVQCDIGGYTQNNSRETRGSEWQVFLIVISTVIICVGTFSYMNLVRKQQHMAAELLQTTEELIATVNIVKQLQTENSQTTQLLNLSNQNLTLLRGKHNQTKLLLGATMLKFTLLLAENRQQSGLLQTTLQEKTELQLRNKELNWLLNSTLEKSTLLEEENRQLAMLQNRSLHIMASASVENKRLQQLLISERQTSVQLEAENKQQRSILHSDKLSSIWRYCNESTLQCSRCMPGWVEHNSRCFMVSQETEKWEVARRVCLGMGGDLAVVLNAEDQAFLTNLTFQHALSHQNFHSAWIGLQDMVKEGTHFWINGNRPRYGLIYWRPLEPNNFIASWDKDGAGQDCVAIVPPKQVGNKHWLNSWDDIVCGGKRNYMCETTALNLS